jgi:Hint domain/RTX calcium-binding nonapeptide repeat (4 copies)
MATHAGTSAGKIGGTTGDDEIDGTAGDDLIIARAGDDVINGGAGDDTIYAGAGNDVVDGGSGNDTIYGGRGDDEIYGGAGDDVVDGGTGDDVIYGGAGNDVLAGGAGDDVINGGAGDDVISGGSGDDVIRGGAGNDVIEAGAGDDEVWGGAGDDVIDGGAGNDILRGGSGHDVFRFAAGSGNDRILDFDKSRDRIDLTAFHDYRLSQVGNDTVVTYAGGQITLAGVSPEGLADAIDIACVVRGTLIRTPAGEVPVETLSIGDAVVTADGLSRPVKWIGRRGYAKAFIQRNPKVAPVLITQGALGEDAPATDLAVSPEHGIYVDGALVPAKLLVNDDTIRTVLDVESVEYFHVELETPDVLWTNGARTESYVNHGNRRMFANWPEYVARYGGEDEAPRGSDGEYVRRHRVVYGGAALQSIRARQAGTTTLTSAA